jgi:hypothetical protein
MSYDLRGALRTVKRAASPHDRLVEDKEGEYIDDEGITRKGPITRETVLLSWQPATGKQLESLPEGDRTKETKHFWSMTPTALEDKIIIDGEIYTVRNQEYWEAFRINGKGTGYYEGNMVRSGEVQNIDEDA